MTPFALAVPVSGMLAGAVLALVADIAEGVLAEHQVVADLRDVVVLADLPEVPAAVGVSP